MVAPSTVTESSAPSWPGRMKLLDSNYSSNAHSVWVAEAGNMVRLEYHLPERRTLRNQCLSATACIGAVFLVCGVAIVLFAPTGALGEVSWPAVAFAVIAGTFGPALFIRRRYDWAVQRNPVLEWDLSNNRLSVHRGRITFDTADVVGLVALTETLVSDEIPNHTQLQLLLHNSGGTYSELIATSTEPAEKAFVPALREFAARTGCPVWIGHAVEGRQGSKFDVQPLPGDGSGSSIPLTSHLGSGGVVTSPRRFSPPEFPP